MPRDRVEEAQCGLGHRFAARGEYIKAKLSLVQQKLWAYPPRLLTEVPQCQLDLHVAKDVPDDRAIPMEATKLIPGLPEAKVATLHNMLNMCDGEIRMHAGRWTKYESMEEPSWAKEKRPEWETAMAMERRTHPSDQGGHFVEFHTSTEEEIEAHRRLGLRPYWTHPKGNFFAWELAPAGGRVGTCWVKEVQTWSLWPPILPEAALVRMEELAHCGEETWSWCTWWRCCWRQRKGDGEEKDPERNQ